LSAADWTTFNGKAPGVTFTSSYIPYGQGTTTLTQSAGLQFDGTNFTTTGYATATSFRPSSSTVPTNGLYLPAANTIGWATASTARMQIGATGGVSIGNTTDPGATNLSVTGIVSTTGGAFFTGGTVPAVTTTGLNTLSSQIEFIDSARTANNRMAEFIWTGGSFRGRWLNDAYSASTNWLAVVGGQGAGTTSITLTAGAGIATLTSTGLAITGALSKSSGSFRIDHPLPQLETTHQLVHSFIEGPQADLIYRGKVNLVNGTATVNIDETATMTEGTFVALCRDIQCFTTNESDWTAVRGSVTGNILTIEAQDNTSTASISWMVIGERQDKHMLETGWTDENGKVIVEPIKVIDEVLEAK
jgi:hypothetical protein